MLVIDLIIVALTLGVAAWGFSHGVTVGTLALVGFGVGAVLGSRVAPLVLDEGVHSDYAPVLALPGALLFGGLLAAAFERFASRRRARLSRLGRADGIAGALLAACLGLAAAWLVGSIVSQVRSLREPLQRSAILKRLDAVLPPPGPVLVAEAAPADFFPTYEGPAPQASQPDPSVVRAPKVKAAARSVAKIEVRGCGHGGRASGWVAADGIVVTNAHVVAGEDAFTVRVRGQGQPHDATPIWFDRRNDIAVLRVPGVKGVPALPLVAHPRAGTSAALLGFPAGHWDIRPARLAHTSAAISLRRTDRPDPRGVVGRFVTPFLGRVQPGYSGGPMVDTKGRVVATIFAEVNGRSAGLAVPNEIVRDALHRAGPPVKTGECDHTSS